MKYKLKVILAAALAIVGAIDANGQTDVFTDTFDAAPTNGATRVLSPDNSANGGTFPGSAFDVFGIVDRNVNFSFADDTVINNADADDTNDDFFGIILPEKTDLFLGFQDTVNPDNPDGDVSLTWTVSAAGLTDLNLSFEVAAMGDFEASDLLSFTASFDGGAEETLFESGNPDDGTFTYVLQDGTTVDENDPFVIDGQFVVNEFQTFIFPISGSGSQLTLTLNYNTNGGSEVLAIDNVSVTSGGGDGVLKGDVNLDGAVDFFDIQPFIDQLSGAGSQPEADVNCDGVVDFFDIQAFIDVLSGGSA